MKNSFLIVVKLLFSCFYSIYPTPYWCDQVKQPRSCEYVSLFSDNWDSPECGFHLHNEEEPDASTYHPPPHDLVSLPIEGNDTLKPVTFRA